MRKSAGKIERSHFPSPRCKLAKCPISKSFLLDIALAHMHLSIRNKRGNNADCRQITRDVIYVNAALLAASSARYQNVMHLSLSLSTHSLAALFHTHFLLQHRVSLRINVYICVLCLRCRRGQMQFRKVVLRVCLDRNSNHFYAKQRKIPPSWLRCALALQDLLTNVKPFTSRCA
jgi:hypothetical protein